MCDSTRASVGLYASSTESVYYFEHALYVHSVEKTSTVTFIRRYIVVDAYVVESAPQCNLQCIKDSGENCLLIIPHIKVPDVTPLKSASGPPKD